MRVTVFCSALVFVLWGFALAEDNATDQLGASIGLPQFNAKIAIGFNYDFLRSPTRLSFERSRGFIGFNLPLEQAINLRDLFDPATDSIFSDTSLFTNGTEFQPKGSARQNPNFSVMVDVPMLGGVASFSNIENFYLNYQTVLGNSNLFLAPDSLAEGLEFLLRGAINVPLYMTLGWQTMTFGYAYKVNDLFTFALDLHRHLFSFDLQAKIDADLLGRYNIDISSASGGGDNSLTGSIAPISGELDYPSDKINGRAEGHYEAEVWSTTLAMRFWQLYLTYRTGMDTKAQGRLFARYSLPFFIDPESFQPTIDFSSTEELLAPETRSNLLSNATDSLTYVCRSSMRWQMPSALTAEFDIIKDHLGISYTKLFGEVSMKLDNIHKEKVTSSASGALDTIVSDSADFDFGISVDHIMLLQANFLNSFINLGVFAFDFRYGDRSHILGDVMIPEMRLGKSAMLPVLNLGTALGTRMQLLIELDILPLPAVKSGVIYNF